MQSTAPARLNNNLTLGGESDGLKVLLGGQDLDPFKAHGEQPCGHALGEAGHSSAFTLDTIGFATEPGLSLQLPGEALLKAGLAIPDVNQDMLDAAQIQLLPPGCHLPQHGVDSFEQFKGFQPFCILTEAAGQIDEQPTHRNKGDEEYQPKGQGRIKVRRFGLKKHERPPRAAG